MSLIKTRMSPGGEPSAMLLSYKSISIGNIADSIPLRKVDTVLLQKEKYIKKKNHFSNTIGAKKCCESFVLLLSKKNR